MPSSLLTNRLAADKVMDTLLRLEAKKRTDWWSNLTDVHRWTATVEMVKLSVAYSATHVTLTRTGDWGDGTR